MSEELIKRLLKQADLCFDGSPSAKLLREAADALSRPAPAVQVPDADAIAAKWAAEWESETGKRRELKKLFVAALKEVAGDD